MLPYCSIGWRPRVSPITEQNLRVLLLTDPSPPEHIPCQRWHGRGGGRAARIRREHLRLAPGNNEIKTRTHQKRWRDLPRKRSPENKLHACVVCALGAGEDGIELNLFEDVDIQGIHRHVNHRQFQGSLLPRAH